MNFHHLKAEEVLKNLKTGKNGLREKEFELRYKKHGPNKLPEEKKASGVAIFLSQFKSPLIYILAIAGIVTLFLREYADSIVIWLAVVINAVIGYVQESKANNALEVLRRAVKNKVIVIREGREKEVEQEELTIGDIILLRPGDKVPADGRIIESRDLKINESALTGEWLAVEKKIESLKKEVFFADRVNMAHMGTVVEYGAGKMVVTATARNTEFGRVAKIIKDTEEELTPYQQRLEKFSKILGSIIGAICFLIFIEGMLTGGEFREMFITAIAVAVAAIPEGLPIAVTVILAIGMQRILREKGLVRRLASAETLGSTSVICTDKTGTLTEGKMRVSNIVVAGREFDDLLTAENDNLLNKGADKEAYEIIYKTITLLSEAFVENPRDKINKWIWRGRPTDKALLTAGLEAGFSKEKLEKEYKEIDRQPFNSALKFSAAIFKKGKETCELLAMGAPEVILDKCDREYLKGEEKRLAKDKFKELENMVAKMTSGGLRVMAVAFRKFTLPDGGRPERFEFRNGKMEKLIFVGFVGLKDPLRETAKKTIEICKNSGLKPIIITGDHKLTAKAIAKELGLKIAEKNILEGKDLEKISDHQLKKRVRDIVVYARVMPEHKLRIVNAWQSLGKVVAMTGDGINDAPALKKADVGVALGSGTTVAKEVSDLVLLSDDFSVIVAAVEEGRRIIDNIRKVITYLVSSSFTAIILISAAMILGWPMPILAVHILWINLIEDGFPSFALAFEPKEKDIMEHPPLPKNNPLLSGEMKFIIFFIGIITDVALLAIFYYLYNFTGYDLTHIRSVIFVALAIDSIFFVYACKSLRHNIWHIPLLSNKFLVFSSVASILVLILSLYAPVFQALLRVVPLDFADWLILISFGLANVLMIELAKWVFIRRKLAV